MYSKFKLSYEKGIRCGDDRYSIAIPDNFKLEKAAEDRAFIAWLPDGADDYLSADIVLTDGNIFDENDTDSRLYTPEMCASLLENMYWQVPLLRMTSSNTKFIPLNEGYPAGGIIASYEEGYFRYNIQLIFNGCGKKMIVEVMKNVTEEDIPACDSMVIDWIKTMKMTKPMEVVKKLDDPSFVSTELTEKLAAEWKLCSDIQWTIISQILQNKIDARAARYKATVKEGKDSDREVRKDNQIYVEQAAADLSNYLMSAVRGLEAITKKNEGNALLRNLYEVICPGIMQSDSVIKDNKIGVQGWASARIPEYDEIKRRFMILMPDAEEQVEKKETNPVFVMPTYSGGKEVLVGTMVVPIPDHMLLAAESHSDDESSEAFLEKLRNHYALVAIPDDFEKGFDFYTKGAFCINITEPEQVAQLADLFSEESRSELVSNLIDKAEYMMKRYGKYNEEFPMEFVCGDDEFGIVLALAEEYIDPIENWSHFKFFVFNKSNFLQGNVYINAQGEREQFISALKEWLRRFRVAVPARKKSEIKEMPVVNERAVSSETINKESLLKRAFMFLEDGNWTSADEYCEKVLDIDPENASAYLGKLLSSQKASKLEELKNQEKPFDGDSNYKKVIRFGDENIQETLKGYIEEINLRNENMRKDAILAEGKEKMMGEDIASYQSAKKLFESISGWKDADENRDFCQKKIEETKAKEEAERLECERQTELAQKQAKRIAKRNKWITGIIIAVSAAVSFLAVQDMVLIPERKYDEAVTLMENGSLKEAYQIFNKLGSYKKSGEIAEECQIELKYTNAMVLMEEGSLEEAYEIFVELEDYADSADKAKECKRELDYREAADLEQAKVGDTILFGEYEQDNNMDNGRETIEWLVLAIEDEKILVVSKYGLDVKKYNEEYTEVTWETCSLRQWLNTDFVNAAFTEEEKERIHMATVTADENSYTFIDPGNATQDQVFLLSMSEIQKYSDRIIATCSPTDYAVENNAAVTEGKSWWWLRTPGSDQNVVVVIGTDGAIYYSGCEEGVSEEGVVVRPAMWINLESGNTEE